MIYEQTQINFEHQEKSWIQLRVAKNDSPNPLELNATQGITCTWSKSELWITPLHERDFTALCKCSTFSIYVLSTSYCIEHSLF